MRRSRDTDPTQRGVTLVELIVSVLIFSIIAIAGAMFVSLAMNSYLITSESSRSAQAAHNTLNRLSSEFRLITGLGGGSTVTLTQDVSLQYETTEPLLSGVRQIRLAGTDLYLDKGTDSHLLLDNVTDFTLRVDQANTDGDATNQEISTINVTFRINGTGPVFELRVTPREFIRL